MSTFNARSAMEALLPWSPIWISEETAVNLSTIIRWKQLCPVYSQLGRLKRWKCRASQIETRRKMDSQIETPCQDSQIETLERTNSQLGRLKRWKCRASQIETRRKMDSQIETPCQDSQIETLERTNSQLGRLKCWKCKC